MDTTHQGDARTTAQMRVASANASTGNRLRQRRGNGAAIIQTRSIPRNTKGFAAPSWRD
jgi:hypothetical protein